MIKSAMQVKALIRNMADGDSDKSQILLRIYMMERFLERVSASKYRDNFILKGGMLISSLVGVDMRTTMDIDTTVRAVPLEKDTARQILDEIIEIDLEDGVQFQVTRSEEIMEGHEYEGLRFFIEVMQANWDNYRRSNTYVGDLTWEKASSVIPELFSIAEAYE